MDLKGFLIVFVIFERALSALSFAMYDNYSLYWVDWHSFGDSFAAAPDNVNFR